MFETNTKAWIYERTRCVRVLPPHVAAVGLWTYEVRVQLDTLFQYWKVVSELHVDRMSKDQELGKPEGTKAACSLRSEDRKIIQLHL